MKPTRFFDFEVTPNWWLCVIGDLDDVHVLSEDIKDNFYVIHSNMIDAREKLMQLLLDDNFIKCGFNIKHYDLMIANGIYQGFSPQQIKIVNDLIIEPWNKYQTKEHIRLQPFATKRFRCNGIQDLRDDMPENISLKDIEAALGLSIMETTVDFNKEHLTEEDIADFIKYCKHDVYSAMEVFRKVCYNYTKTKVILGQKFGVSEETCRANTNPSLTSMILKARKMTFIDEDRVDIELPEKIDAYCREHVPEDILNRLLTSKELFKVRLFDNDVSYGNGGIHSVYCAEDWNNVVLYIKSDEKWSLVNIDARSYYPSMLIQFDCLSRTFEEKERFINIFDERVALKALENPTPEQNELQAAYKLVLNSTYGASGCKWLPAYDLYQCTRTCRFGQIFLTALCCKLHKTIPGLKIIQMNTDGILVYIPNEYMNKLQECMDEWTAISGINMDRDNVDRIWQRDVNNYLLVKNNGKIKSKGGWLRTTWQNPGTVNVSPLSAFICTKAVTQYLVNKVDILKTLMSCNSLEDFSIFCKKGPTFSGVVQRFSDGHEVPLFKSNRVIATKNTYYGQIFKIKKRLDKVSYTVMTSIPDHCLLVNESFDSYDITDIKKMIDYKFYALRCFDLLDYKFMHMKGNIIAETKEFNYFD